MYMIDVTDLEPVTLEQANEYIRDTFNSFTESFEEASEDQRSEAIDTLIMENNPEVKISNIADNWDTLSTEYSTKTEFVIEMFKNGFSEELRSKIPEEERDMFIQIHVQSIEEELNRR